MCVRETQERMVVEKEKSRQRNCEGEKGKRE